MTDCDSACSMFVDNVPKHNRLLFELCDLKVCWFSLSSEFDSLRLSFVENLRGDDDDSVMFKLMNLFLFNF